MHADDRDARTSGAPALTPTRRKPTADERARFKKAREEDAIIKRLGLEKRQAKTRTYRLGKAIETVLFELPRRRKELEGIVRSMPEAHVFDAFRFGRSTPTWFDDPAGDDSVRDVDTRRFRLGVAVEQLLDRRERVTLRARLLHAVAEEPEHVRRLLEPVLRAHSFQMRGRGASRDASPR